MKTEITKDGIIRYFGNITNFIEYLNVKIERLEHNYATLQGMNLHDVFVSFINEIAINNVSLSKTLVESHDKMMNVLLAQILEYKNQRAFAENLK